MANTKPIAAVFLALGLTPLFIIEFEKTSAHGCRHKQSAAPIAIYSNSGVIPLINSSEGTV